MSRCPNCGAPASGYFCKYCDSPLYTTEDFMSNLNGKTCHLFYEIERGKIACVDVLVDSLDFEYDTTNLYSSDSDEPVYTIREKPKIVLKGLVDKSDKTLWLNRLLKTFSQYFQSS